MEDKELESLRVARDVVQKQIDVKLSVQRQELLEADKYYCSKKTHKLSEYFAGFGLRIVEYIPKEKLSDETRVAKLMFRIKDVAMPIFKRFIAKENKEYLIALDKYDGKTKCTLVQVCEAFEKFGWIKIERTKHQLKITRDKIKAARNFWHGSWAEHVAWLLIINTLQKFANDHKVRYDVFYNVKLAYYESTGKDNDMQLDLVVQLNDRFYIFEVKTGVLGIEKWVERAKLFKTNPHSRFITCYAGDNIQTNLFFPYVLIPLSNLESQLLALLQNDIKEDLI